MKEKVDKMDAKMDHIGTKEDYEKAKQDLMVEKKQNSDLRSKIQDLQGEAKQMQRIAEVERERQSKHSSKKDMDLSDMEQKCVDLQEDLKRKDQDTVQLRHEVGQLSEKIQTLEKDKENLVELQSQHNAKVSDYIDKMVVQHNTKVEKISELEKGQEGTNQKIRELTSQLKDEKQKKDSEIAKRRITEQQMKDVQNRSKTLEEQMHDLKRVNEDSVKARDDAVKSLRNEQKKVKVLDEQKREVERERTVAAEKYLEEKRQLESDNARLQDRVMKTIKEFEQTKEEHGNAVSQALRSRSEEMGDLQNRLLEAEGQIDSYKREAEQSTTLKERAEQVLAEERQEFQISKLRITDMKKELERLDTDRRRHSSHDKENQRMQETLKHQKAMIGDLESQLKLERTAAHLLSPAEAARILKVREDHLIQDNNQLNIELCLAKDELQRLKGGPKGHLPLLEMQQQPSFNEPSSLASTPCKNRNAQ